MMNKIQEISIKIAGILDKEDLVPAEMVSILESVKTAVLVKYIKNENS